MLVGMTRDTHDDTDTWTTLGGQALRVLTKVAKRVETLSDALPVKEFAEDVEKDDGRREKAANESGRYVLA
jgi:hypothetical protein